MKRILGFMALAAVTLFSACADNIAESDPAERPNGDKITLDGGITTRGATEDCYPFSLYTLEHNATQWGNLLTDMTPAFYNTADNSISTSLLWSSEGQKTWFIGAMRASDGGSVGSVAHSLEITGDGYLNLAAGDNLSSDILLSNNLKAAKGDTPKLMEFRHVMSQLIVKLQADASLTGANQVTGAIAAGKASGRYSALAADANVLAEASQEAYEIAYDQTVDNGTAGEEIKTSIYYLIPDGSLVDMMTGIEVNGLGVDDIGFVDGSDTPSSFELKPGVSYTLTLNLNSRGLSSATISLGEWAEESVTDGIGYLKGRELTVKWDAAGADITAIELTGADNSVFTANVVKTDDGIGYARSATDVAMSIDKVFGYHGEARVEMVSPKADAAKLWAFTAAAGDTPAVIELKRVLVQNADHLANIDTGSAAGVSKHHFQVADIDLSAIGDWLPIGLDSASPFTGSYVGGGYKISNLGITTKRDNNGLFGINESGLISDVHIASGAINVNKTSGAICGINGTDGIVRNCVNSAELTAFGYRIGGIVGENTGEISGCVNRGKLTFDASTNPGSKSHMGGIAGRNNAGTISACANYGLVDADESHYIGGIVGNNLAGVVDDCDNHGKISAPNMDSYLYGSIGGIAGTNTAAIKNSRNFGQIAGHTNFGGIAGRDVRGTIEGCTNSADLTGNTSVGGIVGFSSASTITNSANKAKKISGKSYIGGVVGDAKENLVLDCTNAADIEAQTYLGGIVGHNDNMDEVTRFIENCTNTGNVRSLLSNPNWEDKPSFAGGIIGQSEGPITGCRNKGAIYGEGMQVGGIAGQSCATVKNCENRGSVQGCATTGGIVGQLDPVTGLDLRVEGSKNYGEVTGIGVLADGVYSHSIEAVGGIVGRQNTGKVTGSENFGNVKGFQSVGGISGKSLKGDIDNTRNHADIYGVRNVGGIVGDCDDIDDATQRSIKGSTNYGSVTASGRDSERTGGIAGFVSVCIIDDCHNKGNVSGRHMVGGVCGYSFSWYPISTLPSEIRNSTNEGTVSAAGHVYSIVGGIAGHNLGVMKNCVNKASGKVTGQNEQVGGIAGGSSGNIQLCRNEAYIHGGGNYVGGIAGNVTPPFADEVQTPFVNDLGVFKCANTGNVEAYADHVGGIAGQSNASLYANHNSGEVVGADLVGGIVGSLSDKHSYVGPYLNIVACYNTGDVSGDSNAGGIAGEVHSYSNTSLGAEAQLKVLACYSAGDTYGGSNTGIIVGSLTADANQQHPMVIRNNYWVSNSGLSGAIGSKSVTTEDIDQNVQFSALDWPADNSATNWGVGDDAAAGRFWKPFAAAGSSQYPQLAWE